MEPVELGEFLELEFNYPEPIIGNAVLSAETKMIMFGEPKSFKSMIGGVHLADAVSTGTPWLGIPTRPSGASILYFQSEVNVALLQGRFRDSIKDKELPRRNVWIWHEPVLKLDTKPGIDALRENISKFRPEVFILDPLYKAISGDMNQQQGVTLLFDVLDNVIHDYKCSVIVMNHTRKKSRDKDNQESESSIEDQLGSQFFGGWPDSIVKLSRPSREDRTVIARFDASRNAKEEQGPVTITVSKAADFLLHRK